MSEINSHQKIEYLARVVKSLRFPNEGDGDSCNEMWPFPL